MKHGVLLYKFTAFRDILDFDNKEFLHSTCKLKISEWNKPIACFDFFYDIFNPVTSGEVRRSLEIYQMTSLFCLSCAVYLTRSVVGEKGKGEEEDGEREWFLVIILKITKDRFDIIYFQGHWWRINPMGPFQQLKYSTWF